MLSNKSAKNEGIEVEQSHGNKSPRGFRLVIVLVIMLALAGAGVFIFNHFHAPSVDKTPAKKAVPVTTAIVEQKTIASEINVIGTVQAYSTVQVKSQVIGQLMKVHFNQGDFVKKGQILFTIDERSARAQLEQAKALELKDRAQVKQARANVLKDASLIRQAEAALAKDHSSLSLAKREAQRYKSMVDQGAVSSESYDQQKTTEDTVSSTVKSDEASLASAKASMEADQALMNSLEAQVDADHAAAENARVSLSYTTIYSPLDGRTGSLNIHEGNLIKDNDATALISIDQVSPIYVTFAVPEQYLSQLTKYSKAAPLKVSAVIEGEKEPESGAVTFIDNSVDSTTGTINLKATFPNTDKRLWPGQFVNVTLLLKQTPNTIVVPAHAVQTGQDGQFVFVVKNDSTVSQRPVKMERTTSGSAVITRGLKPGEVVVTDGQMQLTDGALVAPKKAISEDD